MKKQITTLIVALCIISISSFGMVSGSVEFNNDEITYKKNKTCFGKEDYGLQWEMNYGSDPNWGARYQGPQPIGDCDNDGLNELLIGGRDGMLRVMEWNENKQTYDENRRIHGPYYHWLNLLQIFGLSNGPMDPGGFAIGDLTGDGKNEVAGTWMAGVHKYFFGDYRLIGFNPWIFNNGGGNPDCLIGDYDDDGRNELIMSGGPIIDGAQIPELIIYEWRSGRLIKEAEWDDPGIDGYIFYSGIGDADNDGDNEIVCGNANKVIVLDWNTDNDVFDTTVIKITHGWEGYPFANIIKDSDMDGLNEIHVSYYGPRISIFEWDGNSYEIKYEKDWPGEGLLIEALDVGDVDDDGKPEVCAGTDIIHILQWNGETYEEEALIDETFGDLAVLCIGDCDNDGKNEINAGSVIVNSGEDFMSWIFKYGWG
jgi:hypothetical protein